MNAAIVCVGKLKEEWQRMACAEYLKRLSRFGTYSVREVDDLPEPAHSSPAIQKQIMEKEGKAILKQIKPGERVVALCIRANAPDSEKLAAHLSDVSRAGGRVAFVIGGSLGLSEEVIARADEKISLSNLTMPHALARIVLLEQLYRSEKIVAGERYHK
ncbi:MAG: 23S rRNA (pseudouridine(1915)-N(3))-methyltransferase RlmH [Eubacteriales bacterium]|nr:23S rRNA (pseudouridine(1915)-N(3))-methyltransferase RlmH [Eubacteriales bacterium]